MDTDNVSSELNVAGDRESGNKGSQVSAAAHSKKALLLIVSAASLIFLLVILMTYFERANLIINNTQEDYEAIDTIDELQIILLRIEAEFSNFILTGEIGQISDFQGDINLVSDDLERLHEKWQGFVSRSDIVELKTDIDQVVDKLKRVISSGDLKSAAKRQAVDSAKQAIHEVREELSSIRNSLVLGTKVKHADNVQQVGRIKWTILSLSGISFVLILLLFSMTLKNDQLHRKLALSMANKHQELEAMVEERTRELMGLASYLTRMNENERSRIARELHDELGALLTAANMDSAWIERNLRDEDRGRFAGRLARLSDNLKRGIALKRQITTSLVPPLLRELGLQEALHDMIAEVDAMAPETKIDFSIVGELPQLDPEQELALYRICQESLTNISKYAKASHVQITLKVDQDVISMDIEDNGVGFDTARRRTGTHGIVSLRSRAAMFEGTLNVSSVIDQGTKVSTSMKMKSIQDTKEG